MFARCIELGVGIVFGIYKSICVGIRSTRVGVFVWQHTRLVGKRGIDTNIELH